MHLILDKFAAVLKGQKIEGGVWMESRGLRKGEEMNIWVSNVTVLDKNLNYWVQNEKFLKELLLSVLS